MPYTLNFPQALDFMRDSQPLMLGNYASIFNFIGQDHVPFNSGGQSGKHAQLTFPISPQDPPPTNEWKMYAKSVNNLIQIFTESALNTVIPFGEKNINQRGLVSSVKLPSGIIIKWLEIPIWDQGQIGRQVVWSLVGGDTMPFTTQYWAAVFLEYQGVNPGTDLWQYASVFDISDPTKLIYTQWFRSPTILTGVRHAAYPVLIVAIGV